MKYFAIFAIILTVTLFGCDSGPDENETEWQEEADDEQPENQVVEFENIRNYTKIKLSLLIKTWQLQEKITPNAPAIAEYIQEEIMPDVEKNRQRNEEITLGSWRENYKELKKRWARGLAKDEKEGVFAGIEDALSLAELPTEGYDELLEEDRTQKLHSFLLGMMDALQLYLQQ